MAKKEVASTALFVAAVRARENERPDPLFKDALSGRLAGPEGLSWLARSEADPASRYRKDGFPYLEVRTRYFDDWALAAVKESKARQLVLLGAGMDTRAFRLGWPGGFRIWEVDTRELFSLKEPRLRSAGASPRCERTVVEADLTDPDWVETLMDRGLDKDRATLWLAEGLFMYLTPPDVDEILEGAASASPVGSRFGVEIVSEDFFRRRSNWRVLETRKQGGRRWGFGSDDPRALLARHGWKVDGIVGPLEAAIALGRVPPPAGGSQGGRRSVSRPGASFVTAARAKGRRLRATVV